MLAKALLAGKVNSYLNMADLCQNHFQSRRGPVAVWSPSGLCCTGGSALFSVAVRLDNLPVGSSNIILGE